MAYKNKKSFPGQNFYITIFMLLFLTLAIYLINNYLRSKNSLTAEFSNPFAASGLPSSQATFYASNIIDLGALAATGQNTLSDTGYVTIMASDIKTPEQKDITADISLQCGLLTDTTVKSKNGSIDTAQAKGSISIRVKATNQSSGEVRYFIPSEKAQMPDHTPFGITYCSRLQQLDAQFGGLNCTADLTTGIVTCADPEMLRLLLQTMNANSFNYLLPNMTSGVWHLEVQARAQSSVQLGGDLQMGAATAKAFVGVGSMNIEIQRLIKNANTGPVDIN